MLTKEEKDGQIKKVGGENSTGSSAVQIALVSKQITKLIEHTQIHKGDRHSRRGLLNLVEKRRRLMKYLKRKDYETYEKVADAVGLKKS